MKKFGMRLLAGLFLMGSLASPSLVAADGGPEAGPAPGLFSLSDESKKTLEDAIAGAIKLSVEGVAKGVSQVQITDEQKKLLRDAIISVFSNTFDEEMMKQASGGIQKLVVLMVDAINEGGGELGTIFEEGGGFHEFFTAASEGIMEGMGEWGGFAEKAANRATRLAIKNSILLGITTITLFSLYTTVKYGIPLAIRRFEEWLKRPTLIIDSSLKESYIKRLKRAFGVQVDQPSQMVFSPDLKHRLDNIVRVTKRVNQRIKQGKKNVKYRNLMLWGPPGTGKTMFAKELAKQSGLPWALMSGASFAKFKEGEGIEALDRLFKWAKGSKGLIIIIDEAEGFLMSREKMDPNSKAYQLLNNFLNYTGERSDRFMLVFMTNHKDIIDSAMFRRIDDLIELPLPIRDERKQVLELYKNKLLMDVAQNGVEFVESADKYLNNAKLDEVAMKTEGLSSGDLEGIINTIRTDADVTETGLISDALINMVVDRAIEKHRVFSQKQKQIQEQALSGIS